MLNKIVSFVFGKLPVLRLFSGYKTLIGQLLIVSAGVLLGLQESLQAVQQVFPNPKIAAALAFVGLVVKTVGELHAKAKNAGLE